MIGSSPSLPSRPRHAWTLVLPMVLRLTLSVTLLLVAYYAIPTGSTRNGTDLPWLLLDLSVFAVLVGAQIPLIVKSRHPILRAVEALGVLVPVYLLIFARIYVANSQNDPAGFSSPLDHVTALYFTVTVFATVGFGDITAQTDTARLVVTAQMLLDLVVLGLVVQLIFGAVKRSRSTTGGRGT
jgi:hypothetical protein